MELRYFRDVDKREVDFILLKDRKPIHFIECKKTGKEINPSLRYLKRRFLDVPATQVSLEKDIDLITKDNIRLCSAYIFLDEF
jgi:predicted AAA+ superfamily ATPase